MAVGPPATEELKMMLAESDSLRYGWHSRQRFRAEWTLVFITNVKSSLLPSKTFLRVLTPTLFTRTSSLPAAGWRCGRIGSQNRPVSTGRLVHRQSGRRLPRCQNHTMSTTLAPCGVHDTCCTCNVNSSTVAATASHRGQARQLCGESEEMRCRGDSRGGATVRRRRALMPDHGRRAAVVRSTHWLSHAVHAVRGADAARATPLAQQATCRRTWFVALVRWCWYLTPKVLCRLCNEVFRCAIVSDIGGAAIDL